MSIINSEIFFEGRKKIFFVKVYKISDKCVHCESCKNDCPVQAIENFSVNQDKCIQCGDCFEICPVGAIVKNEDKNLKGE